MSRAENPPKSLKIGVKHCYSQRGSKQACQGKKIHPSLYRQLSNIVTASVGRLQHVKDKKHTQVFTDRCQTLLQPVWVDSSMSRAENPPKSLKTGVKHCYSQCGLTPACQGQKTHPSLYRSVSNIVYSQCGFPIPLFPYCIKLTKLWHM